MTKCIRGCLSVASITCASIVALALFITAVGATGPGPATGTENKTREMQDSAPEGIDLDVTFINRDPLYKAYCVEYMDDAPNQPGRPFLCPGTEDDRRWPDHGEIVTFTAHIINKGTLSCPAFDYAWQIDGTEVANGMLPALAPSAEVTATYHWPWAHALSPDGQRALGEHTVRFTADPSNAISETYDTNNSLEDQTNAMSFSMYITPEMYEAYNVPADPRFPYSAEDWLQKQVEAMNGNFADAIYPVTPQGAPLRVRINTISTAPTNPGPDGEHDGGWFIKDDVRCDDCAFDPATNIDWDLIHELSHQVSLIDLYAIGVSAANVFVQDRNGLPANFAFAWQGGGIMGGGDITPHTDQHLYSSHSAGGASTFAGYRNGYYGSYMYDVPLQNTLRILDSQGSPAPGVEVALYQRTGPWDWTGHMGVDGTPEISGTTDASGLFLLPNRSANGGAVTLNGHALRDNPFGVVDIIGNQGLFLIQLTRQDHEEFHWLDITEFNLAHWMGNTISHTFTISSHVPPQGAPDAPELEAVRIQGMWASLEWKPSPSQGVAGYRVYRAGWPQYEYVPASGLLTETHFTESGGNLGGGHHRIYAVTAVGGDALESGFSEPAYAPGLGEPVAVAMAPDGARTVLNNWSTYPLLRQRSDGRYTHRLVNVHYDLWNAPFLVYDPAGRLVISGFGAFPDGRPAVRVYDQDMGPLWAFGEEGSAPGQFVAPSGVATWGPACTFGGPFATDSHTLLLLHLDGDYTGAQGEIGTAIGTGLTEGRFGQGVLFDESDTLTYTVGGNLNHTRGAVEFWMRPAWDGDDGGDHTLFWWGNGEEFFHLRKDAISNLVFDYFYEGGSCGAPTSVAHWRADEWHHVAFTWRETEIRLYVDGRQVALTECGGIAQPTARELYVGSRAGGAGSIEAVIDELRISSIPRVGFSATCERVLVADSGAHRIQAFDSLGNVLTTYGSAGSGAGQFNSPQGLAVDKSGRVLVADQGNNRLVVLGFEGTEFSYLDSFSAGFNAPTDVAVDAWGNIAVADTGNHRVVVLDPEGNLMAEYSQPNDGYMGPFNAPRGVAVERCGNLVVADTGNRRMLTVRGALPGCRTWLPLVVRRWGTEE